MLNFIISISCTLTSLTIIPLMADFSQNLPQPRLPASTPTPASDPSQTSAAARHLAVVPGHSLPPAPAQSLTPAPAPAQSVAPVTSQTLAPAPTQSAALVQNSTPPPAPAASPPNRKFTF